MLKQRVMTGAGLTCGIPSKGGSCMSAEKSSLLYKAIKATVTFFYPKMEVKLYYKKTGKQVSCVPLYIAPKLKQMYFGNPILFDPDVPMAEERRHICRYLMDEITDIAVSLPEHTVIPYRNIPKKYYPKNVSKEASHANP